MDEAERSIRVPPDPAQAAQEGSSVRKARGEERTQVVRVLARAFYSDPVSTWFFRQDSRRMEQLERVFGFFGSRVWFPHDLTYTTEHVAGAAVWIPPEQWRVSVFGQLWMMLGWSRA